MKLRNVPLTRIAAALLACLLLPALSLALSACSEPRPAEPVPKAQELPAAAEAAGPAVPWDEQAAVRIDLGAAESGKPVTIGAEGTYVLSGALKGSVLVDAPKGSEVRLVLDGASVTSPSGPAIRAEKGTPLTVTLAEGTENALTAGASEKGSDAALYAEDSLTLNGNGRLTVSAAACHGILSKGDLLVEGGSIRITASGDGLRGRESVTVTGGAIDIDAKGDAVAATLSGKKGKATVTIGGGVLTVRTGTGAGALPGPDAPSRKGIKSGGSITIEGGAVTLDCEDDGLHAEDVTIEGGAVTIRSGDDAVHADHALTVRGGAVDVLRSHEGFEGNLITVSGGAVSIVSGEDGINASGGGTGTLVISGGAVTVRAGGDGLDSNGDLLLSGGTVCVRARSVPGEGAIDFTGSGALEGCTLIAACHGGLAQDMARLSGQCALVLAAQGSGGEEIALLDGSGAVLASFTPDGPFDTLMLSSGALREGDACSVTAGGRGIWTGAMENTPRAPFVR